MKNTTDAAALNRFARRRIASCLMLACAASSMAAVSAVTAGAPGGRHVPNATVTNCDDDGAGSLRAAIAAASSGDTIDLTALACSTISLTTGFIGVAEDDLP